MDPINLFEEDRCDVEIFSVQIVVRESRNRRFGWICGFSVWLADGMFWSLPPINLGLLITNPWLRDNLSRALELGDEIRQQTVGSVDHTLKSMIYHAQMANIAVLLLQINYDLSNEDWKRLLSFKTTDQMLTMTLRVSQEFARSISVWMPFFRPSGGDDYDHLLVN